MFSRLAIAPEDAVSALNGDPLRNPASLTLSPRFMQYVCAFFAVVVLALVATSRSLPAPVASERAGPSKFSEERARVYLEEIAAVTAGDPNNIRLVGSPANEKEMPELIESFVASLKTEYVEIERQVGSGVFPLSGFLGGFTSIYHDVQNVLVRVQGSGPRKDESVMISVHYDAAVGSPAGSDNGANVANLMEILTIIANDAKNKKLDRSVLFVFSGAEETVLQGSHSLCKSHHKWLTNVVAFINVEAAGSGGRELMFQSSINTVARAWAGSAPYPFGSVIGQEVFQTHILPSDTDFRQYQEHCKLQGLDFANIDNGQVYHTALDKIEFIEPGAMQRYGTNVLATLRTLTDSDKFQDVNAEESGLFVFFDVFGAFVVVLSGWFIHAVLVIGGIAVLGQAYVIQPPIAPGQPSAGGVLARSIWYTFMYPLISALVLGYLSPMSYYARPWFVIFIYVVPAVLGVISARIPLADFRGEPNPQRDPLAEEARTFYLATTMWAVLCIPLLLVGAGSYYLPYAWSVIPVLVRLLLHRGLRTRDPMRTAVLANTLGVAIPFILSFPIFLAVFSLFIPITGRSGSRLHGDTVIAVFAGLTVNVLSLVPSSILSLFPVAQLKGMRSLMRMLWIASMVLAIVTPHWSFSTTHPRRVFVAHTELTHYPTRGVVPTGVETGIWAIELDTAGFGRGTIPASFEKEHPHKVVACNTKERREQLYCGLPYYLPFKKEAPNSIWFDLPQSDALEPIFAGDDGATETCSFKLVSEQASPDGAQRVLTFRFKSPGARSNIVFPIRGGPEDGELVVDTERVTMIPHDDHYYVLLASGKEPENGFEIRVSYKAGTPARIGWMCYDQQLRTKALDEYVSALPEWMTPVSFVARMRDQTF